MSDTETEHRRASLSGVWLFVSEGCNAHEIATWYGFDEDTARAWMQRARRAFADGGIALDPLARKAA